ncbi:MAG: HPr family phosphocarrier protein [Alphaproteobacteria bacterium]|nr:HPr family phosphocarrier protein [Alphaproteobacteria bacterium]
MSVSKNLVIKNRKGLHARAAAAFVKIAEKYDACIEVEKSGQKVSGCSIMGLMLLAAAMGTTITIYADGPDEENAINELCKLVDDKFGED